MALVIVLGAWITFSANKSKSNNDDDFTPAPSDPAALKAYEVEIFREYLRIPSVHPDIDYGKLGNWSIFLDGKLKKIA